MTVKEIASTCDLTIINCNDENVQISGLYCCDLLSVVMSKALANCAWVTVMGNINSIAVATLVEMACIVLADNAILDDNALLKAQQHNVNILKSDKPIFETALLINSALKNA